MSDKDQDKPKNRRSLGLGGRAGKGKPKKTLAQGRKPGTGLHGKQTGAPSMLTPDFIADLEADFESADPPAELRSGLLAGMPIAIACATIGIDQNTYYEWRRKAQDPNDPENSLYKRFFRASEQLRARRAKINHDIINEVAEGKRKGNWFAAAWSLERTYQNHYVVVQKQQPIEVNISARDVVAEANAAALAYEARKNVVDVSPIEPNEETPGDEPGAEILV